MSTRQTVDQLTPIGWQNISATRSRALSRSDALWNIQMIYPAAYEVPIGNAVAYHIPWEDEPKVIGLGWNTKNSGLWYYAYIPSIALEVGVDVSIFEYEDGRVRVFPGTLHDRPNKAPFRKRRIGEENFQIAGRRLRNARLRAQMTQADLAAKLITGDVLNNYSVGTIEQLVSRFERGERIGFPELLVKAVEAELGSINSDDQVGDAVPRLRPPRYRRKQTAS
jgi:hypothetical protein